VENLPAAPFGGIWLLLYSRKAAQDALPDPGRWPMAGILFLLSLLLGGAALLFQQAADQISAGADWAGDLCSTSPMLCHHPEYLAYAGGVLLVIAIGAKIGSLAN
jgi:hypothetical protein